MTKEILAWHLGKRNRRLNYTRSSYGCLYSEGAKVLKQGTELIHKGTPTLCKSGYHGCKSLLACLGYGHGTLLSRVLLSGKMDEDSDKIAAEKRLHLWCFDIKDILFELYRWKLTYTYPGKSERYIKHPQNYSLLLSTARDEWGRSGDDLEKHIRKAAEEAGVDLSPELAFT